MCYSKFAQCAYSKPQNHLTQFFLHIFPIQSRVLPKQKGGKGYKSAPSCIVLLILQDSYHYFHVN